MYIYIYIYIYQNVFLPSNNSFLIHRAFYYASYDFFHYWPLSALVYYLDWSISVLTSVLRLFPCVVRDCTLNLDAEVSALI